MSRLCNVIYGGFYFVPRPQKCEKNRSKKSLLNPHFKGFGAISRSFSNRALKTVHVGAGEVPKLPTDDRFIKIFMFFAISLSRRALFAQNGHFIGQREAGDEAGGKA